jgi:hypothetical protein
MQRRLRSVKNVSYDVVAPPNPHVPCSQHLLVAIAVSVATSGHPVAGSKKWGQYRNHPTEGSSMKRFLVVPAVVAAMAVVPGAALGMYNDGAVMPMPPRIDPPTLHFNVPTRSQFVLEIMAHTPRQ